MKAQRLIDRQTALLRHLTDADVIFGAASAPATDPALAGLDPGHLRLEAWFSFTKRVAKIEAVLPRTFEFLGEHLEPVLRAFASACPPHAIGRLANGAQFHDFMQGRWPSEPPYLADLAAIEIAYARARTHHVEAAAASGGGSVRRPANVFAVRCGYDVRSLFERAGEGAAPLRKDTPLLVRRRGGDAEPGIFELPPWLFDELAALDAWTPWTDLSLSTRPDADAIARDLVGRYLLEFRP